MPSIKIVLATLCFIGAISISYAQETCQLLMQQMIENTQLACPELGNDQVCYGNSLVIGIRINQGLDAKFDEAGDIVDTLSHKGYQLDLYSTELETWGIMSAHITPLEAQDQNIHMVMFGSQDIWDATRSSPVRYEGSITSVTNILTVAGDFGTGFYPTTVGETVSINAREPNGRFVRIVDARMNAGWIDVNSVSTTGDLYVLPIIDVIEGTDPSVYAPMQAIYVDRIVDAPSCIDAPISGLLIQTPNSTEFVNVLVNALNIKFNGTMYITADAGSEMWIDVLAGQAFLENGVGIPAGTRATLPMTVNYDTLSPELMPYDMELINQLPIMLLDELIVPVAPLSQEAIDNAQGRG
jgi:hypothetical protein